MSDKVEIRISGPRGSGKTTVARVIAKALESLGQTVEYVGSTRYAEEQFRDSADLCHMQELFTERRTVVIQDQA